MADKQLITEEDRSAYLLETIELFQPMIDKLIFKQKPVGTIIKKETKTPIHRLGQKRLFTVTHRNKSVAWSVEIEPWLWQDASVLVKLKLEEARGLVIPSRKIEDKAPQSQIWRPGVDIWWFIKTFEPALKYMKALQLTPVDVGLFDSLEAAAKNLLKM